MISQGIAVQISTQTVEKESVYTVTMDRQRSSGQWLPTFQRSTLLVGCVVRWTDRLGHLAKSGVQENRLVRIHERKRVLYDDRFYQG